MPDPAPTLDAALADVRTALDSDGFSATWTDTENGVVVRVGAGDADCADCLVPRPVLELMITNALEPTGRPLARLDLPDPETVTTAPGGRP